MASEKKANFQFFRPDSFHDTPRHQTTATGTFRARESGRRKTLTTSELFSKRLGYLVPKSASSQELLHIRREVPEVGVRFVKFMSPGDHC